MPIGMKDCPFSTELAYSRFYPSSEVRTQTFLYPVHMSGEQRWTFEIAECVLHKQAPSC